MHLCGLYIAKKQKERVEKLNKYFYEIGSKNQSNQDNDKNGCDISDIILDPDAKLTYVSNNLLARGVWSQKRKGILKGNKKSTSLITQPSIKNAFKNVELQNKIKENNRNLLQHQYNVLHDKSGNDNNNHNKNTHEPDPQEPPRKKLRTFSLDDWIVKK